MAAITEKMESSSVPQGRKDGNCLSKNHPLKVPASTMANIRQATSTYRLLALSCFFDGGLGSLFFGIAFALGYLAHAATSCKCCARFNGQLPCFYIPIHGGAGSQAGKFSGNDIADYFAGNVGFFTNNVSFNHSGISNDNAAFTFDGAFQVPIKTNTSLKANVSFDKCSGYDGIDSAGIRCIAGVLAVLVCFEHVSI